MGLDRPTIARPARIGPPTTLGGGVASSLRKGLGSTPSVPKGIGATGGGLLGRPGSSRGLPKPKVGGSAGRPLPFTKGGLLKAAKPKKRGAASMLKGTLPQARRGL